jgi:hypothetical protein
MYKCLQNKLKQTKLSYLFDEIPFHKDGTYVVCAQSESCDVILKLKLYNIVKEIKKYALTYVIL